MRICNDVQQRRVVHVVECMHAGKDEHTHVAIDVFYVMPSEIDGTVCYVK